jgi:cytochrome c biogenesis protein CcdA
VAVVGALIVRGGSGVDSINTFVETLSGNSSSSIGGLGILAPLGFAFTAGVASAFNPCGFAMLPAYIGLYLGDKNTAGVETNPVRNIARALLIGGLVTLGFIVLFSVVGLITQGARSVVRDVLPWVGLFIGIGLAIVGSWLLGGGKLYAGLAQRVAARMGDPSQANVRGYFLFGLSYGTASLSCTLPIFLTVVGTSLAVSTLGASIRQFLAYGLGMGLVIVALTLGMALFKETVSGGMRKALPYIQPVGSWLMVVAGTYIVFYWLSIGGLLD